MMKTRWPEQRDRDHDHRPVYVERVTARSGLAALALVDGREVWIPLSATEDGKVEPGVVQVAAWLVRKEDLTEHDGEDPLPTPGLTVISCGRPREPSIGRVRSKAFGDGDLLRVEGDKSVVRFSDKVRTLASRYLEKIT